MDLTKVYIKMCLKALDIQDHKPGQYDLYYIDFSKSGWNNKSEIVQTYNENIDDCYEIPYREKTRTVDSRNDGVNHGWLPRQDQLQDMLEDYPGLFFWDLCRQPEGWLCMGRDVGEQTIYPRKEGYIKEEDISKTAEQALLRMLMSQKYGKVWNGKNWVMGE